MLTFFKQFGQLGNHIFFISSAWFLVGSNKSYGKKIARLLCEVWLVSVLILTVVLLTRTAHLNKSMIIRCLFPSMFNNNWYITSYVLFLALVPFLNVVLNKLTQKQLLIFALFIIFLRIFADPFTFEWSGQSPELSLDKWIKVYFIIAYMKKYLPRPAKNIGLNFFLLLMGLGFWALTAYVEAFDITSFRLLSILVAGWQNKQFYLYIIAIALFNIFRQMDFQSRVINRISGYSLLIYIIHENILIRRFYRPMVLNFIYENFGYDNIVLWIFLLMICTFALSLVLSALFDCSLGKVAAKITADYYKKFVNICFCMLDKLSVDIPSKSTAKSS